MSPKIVVEFILLTTLSPFWAPFAFAQANTPQTWTQSEQVPLCPDGDSTLLPENYPALIHTLSDFNSSLDPATSEQLNLTSEIVKALLEDSAASPLLINITTNKESQASLRRNLHEATVKHPQSSVIFRNPVHGGFLWLQDFWQAFFDPQTGFPVLRAIRDFDRSDSDVGFQGEPELKALVHSLRHQIPALQEGSPLPPPQEKHYENSGAMSGGNIAGLPGGLCLHGDLQDWDHFAKYYCGSRDNETVIDSSWLAAGHVDEMVAVLPQPGKSSPCDFALAFPSPRRAFELLREHPASRVFNFTPSALESFRFANIPLWKGHLGSIEPLIDLLRDGSRNFNSQILNTITSAEFLSQTQGHDEFYRSNLEAQNLLDQAEKTILSRIRSRLPRCDVRVVKFPALFAKLETGEEPGKMVSLLPNPVNTIKGRHLIVAGNPESDLFKRAIENDYSSLGLKVRWVESFALVDINEGGLHCASHSARVCRPRH